MDRVKRQSAFEYAQNVRIHITLHMRNVSSGHLLSIETAIVSNKIQIKQKYRDSSLNRVSLVFLTNKNRLFLSYITKTCLYSIDPLKPHFYIVKLGFTGVYLIFLISAQNIDCGYSLEPPRRCGSNEYPQSMF